jgi:hypothetical protein
MEVAVGSAIPMPWRRELHREGEPSAAVMDTQSVQGADPVGCDTRGWDAHKRTGGASGSC